MRFQTPQRLFTFDSETFLNSQTADTAFSTQFSPIPAGEYIGMITGLAAKEQPKKDNTGVFTIVDITWQVDDARAKEATGRDAPTLRDSLFLDMENGKLATGKNANIGLGRLLDALGLNGQPGNPFQMMKGKIAKLQIVVEPDKTDASKLYNRVKAYGKV